MFHNVRFSFDMLELFMMDSIHTETKVEVYKNFRDKSVLRDPMITYENIVPTGVQVYHIHSLVDFISSQVIFGDF